MCDKCILNACGGIRGVLIGDIHGEYFIVQVILKCANGDRKVLDNLCSLAKNKYVNEEASGLFLDMLLLTFLHVIENWVCQEKYKSNLNVEGIQFFRRMWLSRNI